MKKGLEEQEEEEEKGKKKDFCIQLKRKRGLWHSSGTIA